MSDFGSSVLRDTITMLITGAQDEQLHPLTLSAVNLLSPLVVNTELLTLFSQIALILVLEGYMY